MELKGLECHNKRNLSANVKQTILFPEKKFSISFISIQIFFVLTDDDFWSSVKGTLEHFYQGDSNKPLTNGQVGNFSAYRLLNVAVKG